MDNIRNEAPTASEQAISNKAANAETEVQDFYINLLLRGYNYDRLHYVLTRCEFQQQQAHRASNNAHRL